MLHKLAEDISFYLIINNIIDIEDRDTYIMDWNYLFYLTYIH